MPPTRERFVYANILHLGYDPWNRPHSSSKGLSDRGWLLVVGRDVRASSILPRSLSPWLPQTVPDSLLADHQRLIVYWAKLKAAFAVCLVTLYYYLCLTEAVRPMFVQLQQELHPRDIDAVVMRRKMTSWLLMFVWRTRRQSATMMTFLAKYCIWSRTPTLPSPSPIHSRNIVIEAAASNAEFTVVILFFCLWFL